MHEIRQITYELTKTKQQITDAVDTICRERGEYGTGLYSPIRWMERVFDNYQEASEYLNKLGDDAFYGAFAVQYKMQKEEKHSAKWTKAKEKVNATWNKYQQKLHCYHFTDVKSATIGCKACGSKIASQYLKNTNYCPVCKTDLRPESTLQDIARAKQLAEEANKEFKVIEQEEINKNYKLCWLVQFEYHV